MPMIIPIELPGLAETSLYYAFRNSDVLGQGIVVVLFLFSMVTWCIMIDKGISLKCAMRDTASFLEKFRSKSNPMTFSGRIEDEPSPAARVCEAAYLRLSQMNVVQPNGNCRALSFNEIDIIRATLEQAVADQIIELERKMIFLATAVSISPFLGLFGTVWGIMLAFTELAIAGKADIQTLAPGVSGALLTTVLGLVVAIPSVVGYNIITSRIKSTIVHLDNLVEEFIVKLKIENLTLQEQQEREKQEQARKDQLEQVRRTQELMQLEQERIRQQEQARFERERNQLEMERRENERRRLEQERIQQEQARLEQERIRQQEQIRQEQEQKRQEQERIRQQEQERLEQQRKEQERIKLEQDRLEQQRKEQERIKLEQDRLEQERKEQERIKLEQDRLEQERQEQERLEQSANEQPSLLPPDLMAGPNRNTWGD